MIGVGRAVLSMTRAFRQGSWRGAIGLIAAYALVLQALATVGHCKRSHDAARKPRTAAGGLIRAGKRPRTVFTLI